MGTCFAEPGLEVRSGIGRHEHDRRFRRLFADPSCGFHTINARQVDVHQSQIGQEAGRQFDSHLSAVGLPYQDEPGSEGDYVASGQAKWLLVVDKQHPDRHPPKLARVLATRQWCCHHRDVQCQHHGVGTCRAPRLGHQIKEVLNFMTTTLTRWGLWAVPVAGVLTVVGWLPLFIFANPNVKTDPAGAARLISSPVLLGTQYLYMLGFLCLLFGVVAIYASLAETPGRIWAAAGMIAGVTVTALLIGVWSILAIAAPMVADIYLAGQTGAGVVLGSMSGGSLGSRVTPFYVAILATGIVASVGFGVALWRSGWVAKWVVIVFGLAFALSAVASPPSLIGGVLLVISGFVIARKPLRSS